MKRELETLDNDNRTAAEERSKGRLVLEVCFLVILVLFPMRHVAVGGDLSDVGYNYGNFAFFGVETLGKMWFFSTYLANALGHLLTYLPFGHTVMGLNVYTGLSNSLLAVTAYVFCTRRLRMRPIFAFVGEMIALCLCWCPTALLYNYVAYVLLLACVIFLYQGLSRNKGWMLFLAGACLGCNVFVRFSNLPEMALILAVWAYAVWTGWEEHLGGKGWMTSGIRRMGSHTLPCLGGYLAAVAVIFGWISVRYGAGEYVEGIRLLFAMTDEAADYKPIAMLSGLIRPFREGIYWSSRLAFFSVAASLIVLLTDHVPLFFKTKERRKSARRVFSLLGLLGTAAATALMVYWIFYQKEDAFNMTSFFYTSYDPIYWPAALFLMLAMGIGMVEVLRKGSRKEDRFLGASLILVILITSLGSNNGIYPSFNNLFLVAPYVLWKLAAFTGWAVEKAKSQPESMAEFRLNFLPLTVTLWAFLLSCGIQFAMFGLHFVYCEGTGVQNADYAVVNNAPLKGVGMSLERAYWISEISAFVQEQGLAGQEVILHGNIPALAFYLEMPQAFHSWNDLSSFGFEIMQGTLENLEEAIDAGDRKIPVVIASKRYGELGPIVPKEGGDDRLDGEQGGAMADGDGRDDGGDPKWQLIRKFMGRYGYEKTFENERFVIWQAK